MIFLIVIGWLFGVTINRRVIVTVIRKKPERRSMKETIRNYIQF